MCVCYLFENYKTKEGRSAVRRPLLITFCAGDSGAGHTAVQRPGGRSGEGCGGQRETQGGGSISLAWGVFATWTPPDGCMSAAPSPCGPTSFPTLPPARPLLLPRLTDPSVLGLSRPGSSSPRGQAQMLPSALATFCPLSIGQLPLQLLVPCLDPVFPWDPEVSA